MLDDNFTDIEVAFCFFALSMFQRMFYYNECIDKPWVFLASFSCAGFFYQYRFCIMRYLY